MLIRTRTALAATVLASLTCASAAYAAPTSLDHGFSGDGLLRLHNASHSEVLADQTVLPNGEIELVTLTDDEPAIELWRLHPNGHPDRSFGDHGVFAFALFSNYEDVHLAYDPHTGKSYVSTFLDNGSNSPTTIWRVTRNGALDTGFGHGLGHVDRDELLVNDMVAAQGGGLRVVGSDFARHRSVVLGFRNTGGLAHFGQAHGETVLSSDPNDGADSIAQLPGGKLAIAGNHYNPTTSTLLAYRLSAGGHFDHSFSQDGKASVDPSRAGVTTSTVWAPQVLLRPDGRTAYVAGLNQNKGGTFRTSLFTAGLTATGRPDPAYSAHVFAQLASFWSAAALARDGKVLLTGTYHSPSSGDLNAVVRLTSHGGLDKTWSKDGILPLAGGNAGDLIQVATTGKYGVLIGRTLGSSPHYVTELRAYRGR